MFAWPPYKDSCAEVWRCPVFSPGPSLCFGRKEISCGLAGDSEGLCEAERVFILAPTERELKTRPVCRRFGSGV